MSDNRNVPLMQHLLDEMLEEIGSLEGEQLDAYLASVGLEPDVLLQDYSKALASLSAGASRRRFEQARRSMHQISETDFTTILTFDLSKKRDILAAIRDYAEASRDMTIAARNQKIDDEGDLDSFLEACVRLGVIDSEGNLKKAN